MGWGSGSELLVRVANVIDDELNEEEKVSVYLNLIDLFEDYDCDTIDECEGRRSPKALNEAVRAWRKQYQDDWD